MTNPERVEWESRSHQNEVQPGEGEPDDLELRNSHERRRQFGPEPGRRQEREAMVAMEVEELDQAGYGSDGGGNSESGTGGYSGALESDGSGSGASSGSEVDCANTPTPICYQI